MDQIASPETYQPTPYQTTGVELSQLSLSIFVHNLSNFHLHPWTYSVVEYEWEQGWNCTDTACRKLQPNLPNFGHWLPPTGRTIQAKSMTYYLEINEPQISISGVGLDLSDIRTEMEFWSGHPIIVGERGNLESWWDSHAIN